MKFEKGSKLKMVSKKKVPSGSLRSMEAIRGNRPTCNVRYAESKDANNRGVVERLSKKAIRPRHPCLEVSEAWAAGDVVEVFDDFSWKMATVSEVLGKKYILVRLLGSSQEFRVRRSDIRARKSWQDDARVMVGMGNDNCNGGKLQANLILNHSQNSRSQVQKKKLKTNARKKDNCFAIRDRSVQDIHNTKVRILRRSSNYSSEAFFGACHKVRVIEKEGKYLRVVAENLAELPAQVDAIPRDSPGEIQRPASLKHGLDGHLELDAKGKKSASVRDFNDVDSITCSVGSCSVSGDDSRELPCEVSSGVAEQIAGHFCDNGSPTPLGYEDECLPAEEKLAAEIRRLELRAYRCTIEALHASGPLSWEQEVLITNLRLSLNISNDEHLMQLKHLISASTSIPVK